MPVTTLVFSKFCFRLRTSYKELIWCTNDLNAHIPTFFKRWSFIWRCFFPVSILKDFFSKCGQIRSRIWSHLLMKFLIENFIFLYSESKMHQTIVAYNSILKYIPQFKVACVVNIKCFFMDWFCYNLIVLIK